MESPLGRRWGWLASAWLVALLGTGCTGRIFVPPPAVYPAPDAGLFQPLPPQVYGNRIKNLLISQPLNDQELSELTADAGSLPDLIDGWMAQPQWRQTMLLFFEEAFQQSQVTLTDYFDELHINFFPGFETTPAGLALLRDLQEMFARTALELMDEGAPFTDVVTTQRFMVTPPILSLMAYADATPTDDNLSFLSQHFWVNQMLGHVDGGFVLENTTPIAMTDSIDPASPNFMKWYDPTAPMNPAKAQCKEPLSFDLLNIGTFDLAQFIIAGQKVNQGVVCAPLAAPQFTDADYDAWQMVNVRPPNPGEERTLFYDIPALRTLADLVVTTPRIGFMTTPAFFANWQTNTSNEARVTTNQTMIVALGFAFDDTGVIIPVTSSTDGGEHAQPGTTCYGCHQTLDPMRDFFRQSYTYSYSQRAYQTADAGIPSVASFSAEGSTPITGNGIFDLANDIAQHPRFPVAWAQKVCRFANSSSCQETDPEFQRVVGVFSSSNYDFRTLMREMLSSPLVTFASETATADANGVNVGIAPQNVFCNALSVRLGISDLCGLYGVPSSASAATLSQAIPADNYTRGVEAPLMPTAPNLFFSLATQNMCLGLAQTLVDAPGSTRFQSSQTDAAFSDLVSSVMGVTPSDGRFAALKGVLSTHYTQAVTDGGVTPTQALQSAFTLACESPTSTSMGL